MLLILIAVSCLVGQPNNCTVKSMKGFDVSETGVRAACNELFKKPFTAIDKKALMIIYANGLDLRLGDAGNSCLATPEKLNPAEFKETFLEHLKR